MLFRHPALLAGLALVLAPILIHWWNRRKPRVVSWGASHFLGETVRRRANRIQFEDALLLACRCSLITLAILAIARPFALPGGKVPWTLVLPAFLLAAAFLGAAFALSGKRLRLLRWCLLLLAVGLGASAIAASISESALQWARFAPSPEKETVLVLDNSASTLRELPGESGGLVFDRLLADARAIVRRAPEGTRFAVIGSSSFEAPAPPIFSDNVSQTDKTLRAIAPASAGSSPHALVERACAILDNRTGGGRILFVHDGQAAPWDLGDIRVADFDKAALNSTLILHQPALAGSRRNLSVQSVSISREVIGTDRPIGVTATIANTGSEALTPGSVHFLVNGTSIAIDRSVDQLRPGESADIRFEHHFQQPGTQSVTIELDVDDELAADDVQTRAILVRGGIKVLIIEGNDAPRSLERAGTFVRLALTPESSSMNKLAETTSVAASISTSVDDFSQYELVILAATPRLPSTVQQRLTEFVNAGGGLFMFHDARAHPEFFNQWSLVPGRIGEWTEESSEPLPRISLSSMSHPALAKSGNPQGSDLDQATLKGYWVLTGSSESVTAASLSNGEAFLLVKRHGNGSVAQLCTAMDGHQSGLAKRDAFVPFVHELVSFLANPSGSQLHFDRAGDAIKIRLPGFLSPAETTQPEIFRVTAPDQTPLSANVSQEGDSLVATIPRAPLAGLYRIHLPADSEDVRGFARDGKGIPFSVALPSGESQMDVLDEGVLQDLNQWLPTMISESVDATIKVLDGQLQGRDLGSVLLLMALLMVVLEILLTSWITRSRRVGS
ncbi:MAG: BatA domain-containing protein [Verrucomicrobiota bacterium]